MSTRRVNLRIDEETYLAFEKVAEFFNQSVASLVRQSCEQVAPLMRDLGNAIDQAKAGDAEAAHRVFQVMLSGYGHQLAETTGTIDAMFADAAKGENDGRE